MVTTRHRTSYIELAQVPAENKKLDPTTCIIVVSSGREMGGWGFAHPVVLGPLCQSELFKYLNLSHYLYSQIFSWHTHSLSSPSEIYQ